MTHVIKKIAQRWEGGPLKAHMADELFYRHWTEWKDGKRTHILLAPVDGGAVFGSDARKF